MFFNQKIVDSESLCFSVKSIKSFLSHFKFTKKPDVVFLIFNKQVLHYIKIFINIRKNNIKLFVI